VARVEVPDVRARADAAAGATIGLVAPDGTTRWFGARAMTPSTLAITLPQPLVTVAVLGWAHGVRLMLGPPSIVAADGNEYVADGQLQDALIPAHWTFAGFDGAFSVFANPRADSPLRIEAVDGRSISGAWVRASGGTPAEPTVATVFSPHGARVGRSVAATPGWSATWRPRNGRATALTVQRDGLVQAVDVPPGLGVVTWRYSPPGFLAGLLLSLAAAALVLVFFLLVAARRSGSRLLRR
jgi:hypothetical protein